MSSNPKFEICVSWERDLNLYSTTHKIILYKQPYIKIEQGD